MRGALILGNSFNRQLHRSVFVFTMAIATLSACGVGPRKAFESRATDIQLPLDATIIEDRVPLNATLDALLRAHRIAGDTAPFVIAAAQTAFNLRTLRAGQPYRIVLTLGGLFRSFEYTIDRDRFLRVAGPETGQPSQLTAEILEYPKLTATAAISGEIDARHPSLVAAVDHAGERVEMALQLAEVFGGQVDFNSDLQPGDHFQVLFEKDSRDGEFSGYGAILAAALVNGGRQLQAFRFVQGDGRAGYFDENGRSVRRFFLPSPLPFNPRVTSGFSWRRLHPVYGVSRAHLGVDYAAPVGTPVLAIADGVVVSAGFSGASGRLIRLRHANGYQTYYLHLSSIAKGLRPGVRVSQGDVIGRVGASGAVTGPHLDYRLMKHGVFVNPLVEQRKLPAGDPISAGLLKAFEAVRDEALVQLMQQLGAPETLVAGSREPADARLARP
jgi:murein DD-endopeptidase MepM/ murein hydrolase activator NlpD